MDSKECGFDLLRDTGVVMTVLLVVLALGSLLAMFWWVGSQIGADPSSPPRLKHSIRLDRGR